MQHGQDDGANAGMVRNVPSLRAFWRNVFSSPSLRCTSLASASSRLSSALSLLSCPSSFAVSVLYDPAVRARLGFEFYHPAAIQVHPNPSLFRGR